MDKYLLALFTEQPRRYRVIENTVRNRRTQANLFWALNYQILNWWGSADQMTPKEFDHWLHQQQSAGLLIIQDDVAWLTPQGNELKQQIINNYYQPCFDQWTWLVNVRKYAERFLLGVQASSELSFHNHNYVPLNISPTEMTIVRNWLTRPDLLYGVHQELMAIGSYLSKYDQRLAALFAHTLLGHATSGWTVVQATQQLRVTAEEVVQMRRDIWLGIASYLAKHPQSNLGQLMNPLLNVTPISNSAWRTVKDFQNGYSVMKIAQARRLKISTVREHLLEAAIIIPQALQWDRLLSKSIIDKIHAHYSGPVATWRFQRVTDDPASVFFYFRLVQIWELHHQNG